MPDRCRPIRTRFATQVVVATLAVLAPISMTSSALAASDGTDFEVPALETLGETHRVREGRASEPTALAADAERAAADIVSGTNPLLDSLSGRHVPGAPGELGGVDRRTLWSDTWITDVDVLLPGDFDRDGDGFFAGFELTLDIDTDASARDVYAIIELTDASGYLALRHDTAVFTVYGYSSADRYRVEVELLNDHAAGYHDLSIDVRDAHDGQRLDRVSAHDFRSLASLPLEAERDGFFDDDPYHHGTDRLHDGTSYVAGYAAAGGPLGVLSLLGVVLWRRAARRLPR